jgi:hypothetical protein
MLTRRAGFVEKMQIMEMGRVKKKGKGAAGKKWYKVPS